MLSRNGILVRDLRSKDKKEVIANYYARYDELKRNRLLGLSFYKNKPSLKAEIKWFNNLLKDVRNGDSFAAVAIVDGRLIGICDVRRSRATQEENHTGAFGIAINEGFRSVGAGSAMLKYIIKKARRRYEILTLNVFGNNRHAINLYKKFGFRRYGHLAHGYKRSKRYFDQDLMYLKTR